MQLTIDTYEQAVAAARPHTGVVRRKRQPRPAPAALEDLAANGLPDVDDCTPWEELRQGRLARSPAQRPAAA
ncbi:hypothetical protein [Streptomyces pseudovenezuelae]|uniref:hypothetical protein n=1 Tax=Streptomyces pseudovenezuelae TaxID=67350 RepID=UPI00371EE509